MSSFLGEEAPWRNSCARLLDDFFSGEENISEDKVVAHEFEVRFGHYETKQRGENEPYFCGGISYNAYRRLLDRHRSSFQSFYVESEHMLRSITSSTTVHIDQDRQKAIEKTKLQRLDITEWALRFQASKETEMKPSEYNELLKFTNAFACVKRKRRRHSFWLIPNKWRLDVTEVDTIQPGDVCGRTSWEAELEFTGQFSLAESGFSFTSELARILFPLLQIIQDSFYPIDNIKYQSLQRSITNYRDSYPFIGLVQPRPLSRQDLTPKNFEAMTSQYAMTLKADGERAHVLFDEAGGAFLYTVIDGWRQLPLGESEKVIKYTGTLIDGEYDGHRFYAFDLITMNSVVLGFQIKYDLADRLELLHQIRKDTNNMFEVKEYIFFNTFDALTQAANKILNQAETHGPFTIDGLIFTPTTISPNYKTKTWSAQWKWKIQPTIDLMYAFNPSENALYASCAKHHDEDSDLILFNPVDANLYPGRVAEFTWDKNRLIFIRLRPDKSSPNFVSVATDILQSFRDPITRGMITGKTIRLPSVPKVPTISKKIKETTTNKKVKIK